MSGAVLILVPRFRRWGAWLLGLLLVVFIIYIGANYSALLGKDCTCFPLVKRAVGPAFFFEDGAMLLMAALAGIWSRNSENLRGALVILGAVVVFAGVSFGVNSARESGLKAPALHHRGRQATLVATGEHLPVLLRSHLHALRSGRAQDGEAELEGHEL